MKIIQAINAEEAREQAIDWQQWQATQNLSYDEILEWQNYFYHIAKKYDLEDEFYENGVI